MNIIVYNEFTCNQLEDCCLKVYPDGMHAVIKAFLEKDDSKNKVTTVTLNTIQTLTEELLEKTDVVLWWGHCSHGDVPDEIALRVASHVRRGMGLIVLHSAHYSKPFINLMGTTCSLAWREAEEKERIWVIEPSHPIAKGLGEYFELEHEETYGERFDVPSPDELIFTGWFKGGDVFRSGICYNRGYGKVFYFQPGHETHPTYKDKNVQTVLTNAVKYVAPKIARVGNISSPNRIALEKN